MKQLLQHRLKTNIAGQTGHFQPRGRYVKRGAFNWVTFNSVVVTHQGAIVTHNP